MSKKYKLLLKNAKQIVLVCDPKQLVVSGKKMDSSLKILEDHSIIIDNKGLITEIVNNKILEKYNEKDFEKVIDCSSHSIIPGLIDSHTHPIWSGDRVHEFEMKLQGKSYMEIHKAGGGIGFTVGHTRKSGEKELYDLLHQRVDTMIKNGTTLLEGKSGYGLNLESEMKLLKVLHKMKNDRKKEIDIVCTYLGAHSIPKEKKKEEYVKEIISSHLPTIKKLKDNGEVSPEFIDIFLEKNVFEEKESVEIFKEAQKYGLVPNFHGDELTNSHSGRIASDIGASCVSHLEFIDDEGIKCMSEKKIVGVLLPTTAYILRIEYPPARKMIDNNVPIALATDYNPNAHCSSLPFVMNLSCVNMKMSMNEALVATTINAAAALKKSEKYGSLEKGKFGDCVIINSKDWRHIIYEICNSPIKYVVKKGEIVFKK